MDMLRADTIQSEPIIYNETVRVTNIEIKNIYMTELIIEISLVVNLEK